MNESLSREQVEMLLPYYVNGTLDAAEKQQVESVLKQHPSLRDELTFLRKLQTEVQAMPAAGNSPGELGLRRLQQQLPASSQPKQISPRWRWAAVAAAFLLVVQTSVMMLTSVPGGYQQAGEQQTPLLIITFEPQATEAEIRQLLLQNQLTIVEGPSALGLYKLSAATEPETLLQSLQQSDLVESVQLNR